MRDVGRPHTPFGLAGTRHYGKQVPPVCNAHSAPLPPCPLHCLRAAGCPRHASQASFAIFLRCRHTLSAVQHDSAACAVSIPLQDLDSSCLSRSTPRGRRSRTTPTRAERCLPHQNYPLLYASAYCARRGFAGRMPTSDERVGGYRAVRPHGVCWALLPSISVASAPAACATRQHFTFLPIRYSFISRSRAYRGISCRP